MEQPTRGMVDAVNHSGSYTHPANGATFPKVQLATVADLLAGKRPLMPPLLTPYIGAQKRAAPHEQQALGF